MDRTIHIQSYPGNIGSYDPYRGRGLQLFDEQGEGAGGIDAFNMCRFHFGLPGNDCTKDEKTAEEVGRLRRPTSCAVLGS